MEKLLNKISNSELINIKDIETILSLSNQKDINLLFEYAKKIKINSLGNKVLTRGIIEFSNKCDSECKYCGINKNNETLERYFLSKQEILNIVDEIAKQGITTTILQSGESTELDPEWLASIIKIIKSKYKDMAVTLSVGEKRYDEYKLWKDSGADRFLLKIETYEKNLYKKFHPEMDFNNRLKCLDSLKALGYQTGTGLLIGLPGQTLKGIAEALLYFKEKKFEMLATGPFIPHKCTELASCKQGDLLLSLNTLALMRILTKNTHIPATTALAYIKNGEDYRRKALNAGANVIMHKFTPQKYKRLYDIYPKEK